MAGGRLTEYKKEYILKVDEYLSTCGETEGIFHKTVGSSSNSYERMFDVKLPKIEGFALFIGVHKDTIYKWEKENIDFSDALEKIRGKQHEILVDGSLSGRLNPNISKMMLSSNHGYVDRKDVTSDGKAINLNFDSSFNE